MTKTLNQIIFLFSTKIRIFFQQHWESEYFFLEKKQHIKANRKRTKTHTMIDKILHRKPTIGQYAPH